MKNTKAMMYDNKKQKTIPQKRTGHKESDRDNKTSWCWQYVQWQLATSALEPINNFLSNKIFQKSKLQVTLQLLPSSEGSSLGEVLSSKDRILLSFI